ncbi:hypothetical protein C8R41DRAFT_872181 [Lentinula lateritia]|uniref:Uncharacterized protein n=1 Tax=Lentinula lateritia TaxID=40482 RepID=A0ABQ8V1P6_9AGAR|nr:hypothetical protein C8R41DRAFT_872181 [Lentinula lateritia]
MRSGMSNNHQFSTTASTTKSTTLTTSSSSSTLTPSSPIDTFPPSSSTWDTTSDSDDDGWQDMPIVHTDELRGGLDEEDQRRYHYRVNEAGTDPTSLSTPFDNSLNSAFIAARSNPVVLGRGDVVWSEVRGGRIAVVARELVVVVVLGKEEEEEEEVLVFEVGVGVEDHESDESPRAVGEPSLLVEVSYLPSVEALHHPNSLWLSPSPPSPLNSHNSAAAAHTPCSVSVLPPFTSAPSPSGLRLSLFGGRTMRGEVEVGKEREGLVEGMEREWEVEVEMEVEGRTMRSPSKSGPWVEREG